MEAYRKREEALKELEAMCQKDSWTVAVKLKLMVWRQAKLCRRSFRERYNFDVERWLTKDPTDFASLIQSRNYHKASSIVEDALAYAYWECLRILTLAVEKVAIEHSIDRDRAVCDVFVFWHRHDWRAADRGQFYSKLPPTLGEQLLIEESGWVGSQLNFNLNKRLKAALTGWGESFPENLVRELPGAVLAAYEAQGDGTFVTQVSRMLKEMGSESASRPGKLTSLLPENVMNIPKDEDMAKFENVEMLNVLEQAASLSPQQTAVWWRLREGKEIREIAVELGISENSVSVQKNNAIKKLREASTTAEF